VTNGLTTFLDGRPVWFRFAACKNADTKDFFQEGRGVGLGGTAYLKARRVCAGCPVKPECLEYALSLDPDPVGMWAGTTPKQRSRLRRGAL
jgi:WhiB family transcriptional regulator, redox-sensing transcriptional regulator